MISSRNRLLSLALVLTMLLGITSVAMAYTCTEEVVDGKLVVTEDYGNFNYVFVYEGSEVSGTYTRTYTETSGYYWVEEYKDDSIIKVTVYCSEDYYWVEEYKDDTIIKYTEYFSDDYYEITTFDDEGYYEVINRYDDVVGEYKKRDDGSVITWYINRDGYGFEYIYDEEGITVSETEFYEGGYREETKYDKDKTVSYGEYYPNGDSYLWTYENDEVTSKTSVDGITGYTTKELYNEAGYTETRIETSPFGYSQTTTYDDEGNSITVDNLGNTVAYYKQLEGGGSEELRVDNDGQEWLYTYNEYGERVKWEITDAEGDKQTVNVVGVVDVISEYGEFMYSEYNTETYKDGNLVGQEEYDETGERILFWYTDNKGAKHDLKTLEDGSEIRTITNANGTVETQITTYNADGYVVKDEEGNIIYTYTSTEDEKTGDTYSVTKDGDGKVVYESFHNEETGLNKQWYLDDDGNKWETIYDYDEKVYYENIYDTAGNLVIERVYDLNDKLVSEKKYEVQKVEKVKYVWYPSNTTSTHGFAFRELRPELTEKWYRFTPLDLSREGEYSIPLIGGGKYIIGKVNVKVEGDEVTITYSMPGQQYDTARIESEYLNLLPDLDSLTTVEPDELGEGFTFGEPISIENDLEGDTKVLLFVRNVVTFRDHYTYQKPLSRYWPNSSNYAEYYAYLKSIMD